METVLREHIEATPGVCGGKPRIAGHRIGVMDAVVWHEQAGLSPDEIGSRHPEPTLADGFDAKPRPTLTVLLFAASLAPLAFVVPAWAACPCNVDPVTICTSGDCSDLPALNYEEIDQALHEHAATEGALGDGLISCGGNFSDITAVAGIRRGAYPGSLLVRAELDQCLAVQTYDDADGVMQTNAYFVQGISEADAAECLAAVHRVCNDAVRP